MVKVKWSDVQMDTVQSPTSHSQHLSIAHE